MDQLTIYVKLEQPTLKIDRSKLDYFLPETQRLIGGREEPNSTYIDRPCFHMTVEQYDKIRYCYVNLHGEKVKLKIQFDFMYNSIHNNFRYYDIDIIEYLIERYPPMTHKIINGVNIDYDLQDKIRYVDFPFSIDEYYQHIFRFLHKTIDYLPNRFRLNSYETVVKYPWIRTLDCYVGINFDSDENLGNFNKVIANGRCKFNYVNYLGIYNQNVECQYATVAVMCVQEYTRRFNCLFLYNMTNRLEIYGLPVITIVVVSMKAFRLSSCIWVTPSSERDVRHLQLNQNSIINVYSFYPAKLNSNVYDDDDIMNSYLNLKVRLSKNVNYLQLEKTMEEQKEKFGATF